MNNLSDEAKAMIGAFWNVMPCNKLSFARPHILTVQARKGLDDLVSAGFLTVERFNKHSDKLVWKPTTKMEVERPKVSTVWLKNHSFPLTVE